MEDNNSHRETSSPLSIPLNSHANRHFAGTITTASSLPHELYFDSPAQQPDASLEQPSNPLVGTFRHAPQSAFNALKELPGELARLLKGSANFVADYVVPGRKSYNLSEKELSQLCSFTRSPNESLPSPDHDTGDCTICLESYMSKDCDRSFRYLSCGHLFHKECIDLWLLGTSSSCSTNRCPTCNIPPTPNSSWTPFVYQLMETRDREKTNITKETLIPSHSFARVGAALLSSSQDSSSSDNDSTFKGLSVMLMLFNIIDNSEDEDDDDIFDFE